MENPTLTQEQPTKTWERKDVYQQVTNTIITQLEAGTIPWHQPWKGGNKSALDIPKNFTTGNHYRGVNILLLWSSVIGNCFTSPEWGSFKQWTEKKEAVRKGEKGSMIVYYDTMEKEVDGEVKKIPFLKSSVVFNRCQLASYKPEEAFEENLPSLVERIEQADIFAMHTGADIQFNYDSSYYSPQVDEIHMPAPERFSSSETCTAQEAFYSTLFHELTHWTSNPKRNNRATGKMFGDRDYATEELVAELGAAFLCSQLDITVAPKADHANYIAHWLKVLKGDNRCIVRAASEASKAVDYLQSLQPKNC